MGNDIKNCSVCGGPAKVHGDVTMWCESEFVRIRRDYLKAVEALRLIAEHDMYGAANMRHLAASVLIDLGEGES